jgi:hypothetical protein
MTAPLRSILNVVLSRKQCTTHDLLSTNPAE